MAYFFVKCTPPLKPVSNVPLPLPPARIWALMTYSGTAKVEKKGSVNESVKYNKYGGICSNLNCKHHVTNANLSIQCLQVSWTLIIYTATHHKQLYWKRKSTTRLHAAVLLYIQYNQQVNISWYDIMLLLRQLVLSIFLCIEYRAHETHTS